MDFDRNRTEQNRIEQNRNQALEMIILRTETEAKLSGKNRTGDTRKHLQTNEPNNKL
jgi:hypothetical protein